MTPVVSTKADVKFDRIAPAGFRILASLWKATQMFGQSFEITSGTEGTHSGPTDPHYAGEAYDIGTITLPDGLADKLVTFLNNDLGPRFYAFYEKPGDTPNTTGPHIHVQRAKGTVYP